MEEKSKLFVFEKKEVLLIFIFIVMISAISFTLGVRTGKQLSLKGDDYTKEDIQAIELKSVAEENVDKVVKEDLLEDTSFPTSTIVDDQTEMEKRLKDEMEKLAEGSEENTNSIQEEPAKKSESIDSEASEDIYNQDRDFKNKYTIQLYSNQSEEAAKAFADGFIVKGYDVIINQAVISGKGTWYRVSIGAFDSMAEAKTYLDKNKDFFQKNKYIIQQF